MLLLLAPPVRSRTNTCGVRAHRTTAILRGMAPVNRIELLPKESESFVLPLYETGWLGMRESNPHRPGVKVLRAADYANPQYIQDILFLLNYPLFDTPKER